MVCKVGLALGSGGARGISHIGVLQTLVKHKVPIDYIAGSSIGAMIGSFFAAGQDVELLGTIAKSFHKKYMSDIPFSKMGMFSGDRLQHLYGLFTYHKHIEHFNIPMTLVATDLLKGERYLFTKGPADLAIRASTSIPGVFVPVEHDGCLLVDGGVADRIPVSVVRDMGADLVISVDVSPVKTTGKVNSALDVVLQSIDILQYEVASNRYIQSDVMIRPPVERFGTRDYQRVEELIEIGVEACEAELPHIFAAIKAKSK
ncbi:MAG: patatin-like phospholipase family protein [Bacilli bacterium]